MNQDMETRKRLELMRLIREENHNNQMCIRTREEILYGKSNSYLNHYDDTYPLTAAEEDGYYAASGLSAGRRTEENISMSSFGLRFLIAALLFGVYFYSKTQGISVAGFDAAQIEAAVSRENSAVDVLLEKINDLR